MGYCAAESSIGWRNYSTMSDYVAATTNGCTFVTPVINTHEAATTVTVAQSTSCVWGIPPQDEKKHKAKLRRAWKKHGLDYDEWQAWRIQWI